MKKVNSNEKEDQKNVKNLEIEIKVLKTVVKVLKDIKDEEAFIQVLSIRLVNSLLEKMLESYYHDPEDIKLINEAMDLLTSYYLRKDVLKDMSIDQ